MDANTYGLIVVALVQFATAWLVLQAKNDIRDTKDDIRKVEIATNSMKDALVLATAKASKAEGKEEQRLENAKK